MDKEAFSPIGAILRSTAGTVIGNKILGQVRKEDKSQVPKFDHESIVLEFVRQGRFRDAVDYLEDLLENQ